MLALRIILADEAIEWFKAEMDALSGDSIKFFARYGGYSPLHEGFSLGVMKEKPDETSTETVVDEIQFYIEQRDEWFFDGHDLYVTVNPKLNELVFTYEKA